jgi:metal-sulfur cluster biosynthetic enzyme
VVDAQEVREVLDTVEDPELPLSIEQMGLVYGVDVTEPEDPDVEGARVEVRMTFTAMGCPAMGLLKSDVRRAVLGLEGVAEVDLVTVWDPPWTTDRLSEEARDVLRTAGVTV